MKINKTLRVLQLNGNKIDWMSRENSKALSRITKALKKNNVRWVVFRDLCES
jgi:leucyl aminopeptidase (aminopeptidase T)